MKCLLDSEEKIFWDLESEIVMTSVIFRFAGPEFSAVADAIKQQAQLIKLVFFQKDVVNER